MELRHVSKAFHEKRVLKDLTYAFNEGITCILGASGGGKTTILRMLAGLLKPDSGEVTGIEGKKISAVFQEDRLFEDLTAERNVLITARRGFSHADAKALLLSLGLTDTAARVRMMSGGMKRRVALARALAADYDVLLLDEPCTGLDGATRDHVLRVIRQACAGKTVVCVTHEPADAEKLGASVLTLGDGTAQR